MPRRIAALVAGTLILTAAVNSGAPAQPPHCNRHWPCSTPTPTPTVTPTPTATETPTPTPTATPTATPTPTPTPTPAAVYHTQGSSLLDPCGQKVVVRGVEQMFWQTNWLSPTFVSEIAKTGANTVRVLPEYISPTPTGEPPFTLAQIEDLIQRGIAGHMLVDIAIDGQEGGTAATNTLLRSDVQALLKRYEDHIVIHAKGEGFEDTDAQWAANAKDAIARLRAAGYEAPLYILSRNGGRNLPLLLSRGQELIDADPLHNLVLGWQSYWGQSGYYQNTYGMSLHEAFQAVRDSGLPIQAGIAFVGDWIDGPVDYWPSIHDAQTYGIGWLWWDWRMSDGDLTQDGIYGHWKNDGQAIAVTDPDSIQNTSVRTTFQQTGAC